MNTDICTMQASQNTGCLHLRQTITDVWIIRQDTGMPWKIFKKVYIVIGVSFILNFLRMFLVFPYFKTQIELSYEC